MATTKGTAGNDNWYFKAAPAGSFVLDGLGGVDSLDFGTELRNSYTLVRDAAGAVHVDSISGASAALHGVLYNMEVLRFNGGRDLLDLTTYFDPPTGRNIVGGVSADTLTGTDLADTISAGPGRDLINGLGGDDRIDGGAGIDIVRYAVARDQAGITLSAHAPDFNETVTAPGLGTDTLTGVERLYFSDFAVAFDVMPTGNLADPVTKGDGGNAGKAYRLYQAAFHREPDPGGLGYWISVVDAGNSLYDMATGFIESQEFRNAYGVDTTDQAFLTVIYQNVLGRDYDQAGFDWWLDVLSTGLTTRQQVLVDFSESDENKALLIGTIGDGFEYLPFDS